MESLQIFLAKIKHSLGNTFVRALLYILLGLVLFAVMFDNVKPERLEVSLLQSAPHTIRAPIQVEDKELTDKRKEQARSQVQDVYELKSEYSENRVLLVRSIFELAEEVNKEIQQELEKAKRQLEEEKESDEETDDVTSAQEETIEEPSLSEKVERFKSNLPSDVTSELTDNILGTLLNATPAQLDNAKDLTITAVNNVMSNRIPANQVENAKKEVEQQLKYAPLPTALKDASIALGRLGVIQNEIFSLEKTEQLKKEAVESVEPVKILQGEVIVEEGGIITAEVYRQLELVGLLNNEDEIKPFIGLVVLVVLLVGGLYLYFKDLNGQEDRKHTNLLIFSLVFVISLVFMKLVSLLQPAVSTNIGYVFPAAMSAMLIKILIHDRLAIINTIMLAIVSTIIFNRDVSGAINIDIGIYILFSGIAGMLFLSSQNHRSRILQSGLLVSILNLLIILSFYLIRNSPFPSLEFSYDALMGIVSGVVASVFTIGLLPFFEAGFNILSSMKLIELSNPNHPLLRKILTEAPGTYHHSVMVANLAESACESIGANGLLARVACYYHDIGKTNRPKFFIENQINIENPHDQISPIASKNIIISHVTDGVKMLKKAKLPKEIIDVAEQHHGTTLLKFFYHKAKENGEEVTEEEFRYPGPRPTSKEAAIINISDSVEAAVRSKNNPTPDEIRAVVKGIIKDRLQDGQLNDCDITLKELDTVAHTLCETLNGIFHSRIEYPDIKKLQKVEENESRN
ncbi:cyclic-di-AMP phosphodiesterase PgpH [Bacillus carboniphilus]|uniref:Cyclic-di-AMP phosphodiesterase PgpH n=1 Tax=Bacillus carboniphilus TaxID=86663 RepID=A0ABP3GDG9_9BACI